MSEEARPVGSRPDTIKVEAWHEAEIEADHADLFVVVQGSSLVTGSMALSKAREVNALVTDLKRFGVAESDIALQGIRADVTTGMFGKSSSARYSLRIRCASLDTLADMLGIITSQKNTTLQQIAWLYPEDDTARDRWLTICLQRANTKAKLIAETLGVQLLGVYSMAETAMSSKPARRISYEDDDEDLRFDVGEAQGRMRRVSAEDLGMAVSHSKKVLTKVTVEYRVSGYDTSSAMETVRTTSTTEFTPLP